MNYNIPAADFNAAANKTEVYRHWTAPLAPHLARGFDDQP